MPIRKAQWKTDTQFNFGTPIKTNVETKETGENAYLQLVKKSDSDDNISYTTKSNYTLSDDTKLDIVDDKAQLKKSITNENNWPYTTPSDYIYDPLKIEITGGVAKLKDQGSTSLDWDIPFTIPGDYTYDSGIIDVTGGKALLMAIVPLPYAHWKLNESSGSTASDSSGNGRNGTLLNMENSDWQAGKLNNCLVFDGVNEAVNCGSIASFERTQPFSLEFWFKGTTVNYGGLVAKGEEGATYRGYCAYIYQGKINFYLMSNNGTGNQLQVITTNTINNGSWHHVVITYNGNSLASGIKIYIDGVSDTLVVFVNNLTDTIVTTADFSIASRKSGTSLFLNGSLDEILIYSEELTQTHVTNRYNSGNGTETTGYDTNNPIIYKTIGLTETAGILSWNDFVETVTKSGSDEIKYILSDNDGATWYYYSGGWTISNGTYSQSNTAAEINTNIGSFFTVNNKINVKCFLHSNDGTSTPELDDIKINYTTDASYDTNNPTIETNIGWLFFGIPTELTETVTKPTNTEIKYILSDDDGVTYKYWNGSSWIASNGTYSQSNSASEINSNIGDFVSGGTFKFKSFLHTSDSSVYPELDNIYVADEASYQTDDNLYIDTKDVSHIVPGDIYEWLTLIVTNNKPTNTDIKIMFSVDDRATWLTWNGLLWSASVDATKRANATSIEDAQNNFNSLEIGDKTLDVRLFLYSNNISVTPNVDNINVISSLGYETNGSYESIAYQPENNTNGVYLQDITITKTVPGGTNLTVEVRHVNHALEVGYVEYDDGDSIELCGDIIQWKATFVGVGAVSPQLDLIEISFHTLIGIMRAIDVDVLAIPNNPLLTTDSRLNNLDVTISSRASQTTVNVLATDITAIKKIETGRWKIDATAKTMTFYDEDGITPLYVYNLMDQSGNPTYINPFERVPIP